MTTLTATADALPVAAWLLLNALAVHRLVRLALADTLPPLPWLRWRWERAWGDRAPAVLASCPWCASVWVAAAVVAAWLTVPALWLPLAAVLASSSAASLLYVRTEDQ